MFSISLSEYQSSHGVSFCDQIILVNNKCIFDGYYPVNYSFSDLNLTSKAKLVLKYLKTPRKTKSNLLIPKNNDNLFLGFYDKSIDDVSLALQNLFDLIKQYPHRKFNVILGKGDYRIDNSLCSQLPDNIISFTANNINTHHPRVHFLPMGRDFRNMSLLQEIEPSTDKDYLCYCNFSLNTHPVRKQLFQEIEKLDFLTIDHMGQFLDYSISRKDFLTKLARSKFSICPRGNAFDTFRVWDCLYLGTIPIVVKEATFHEQMIDLPILFLDDYSQFANLSRKVLEDTYSRFLDTKFDYSKLKKSFWIRA